MCEYFVAEFRTYPQSLLWFLFQSFFFSFELKRVLAFKDKSVLTQLPSNLKYYLNISKLIIIPEIQAVGLSQMNNQPMCYFANIFSDNIKKM